MEMTKKAKRLVHAAILFVPMITLYLSFAYVKVEWNPANWSEEIRAMQVGIVAIVQIAHAMLLDVNTKEITDS